MKELSSNKSIQHINHTYKMKKKKKFIQIINKFRANPSLAEFSPSLLQSNDISHFPVKRKVGNGS